LVKKLNICIDPWQINDDNIIKLIAAKTLGIDNNEISFIRIIRKSVDARSRNIQLNLGIEVFINEFPEIGKKIEPEYQFVGNDKEVIIIGAGPAGLFAALRLIELGIKPIIFERGKDVSSRKRDIASIHRNEEINPDSNYGFGEGGAGTFSDGKLYTRSTKKGNITKILEVFYFHGAQEDILVDAHPHIGTNVLPRVIKNIRNTIIDAGGEIHFQSKLTGIITSGNSIKGIEINGNEKIGTNNVILATGHSARDIYYLLKENKISLEAKNFAVGVRVEHLQELIDSIQYKREKRGEYLPPAAYNFVEQVNGRGVYSFCMCPGGMIVPASTADNELVVNGMSPSERNGKYANSGIVVEIRIEDLLKNYGSFNELAGLKFQMDVERECFKQGGYSQIAPAQRLNDFIHNISSKTLPNTSYHPGIISSNFNNWLPDFVNNRLKEGFIAIGKKTKGFITNEAIIVGIESRTSSPIRIPRDEDSFEHIHYKGIFPCGEGAGYAGGIISSAIDGERCAEKVALKLGYSIPSSEF